MRSACVIGSNGFIGSAIVRRWKELGLSYYALTRADLDVSADSWHIPEAEITFFCAAKSRFLDCESMPDAWRVNVDAPLQVCRLVAPRRFVWFSSEAVEKALHTAYGMQKAFVEMGLANMPNATVVRIGKTTAENIQSLLDELMNIPSREPLALVRHL